MKTLASHLMSLLVVGHCFRYSEGQRAGFYELKKSDLQTKFMRHMQT